MLNSYIEYILYINILKCALGVVTEWAMVLIAVPWPLMVSATLALGTQHSCSYPGYFMLLFISTFHFSRHFGWPVCLYKALQHIICIYSIFGLQIIH